MVDIMSEGGGALPHKHVVLHLAQLLIFSVLLFPGVAEVNLLNQCESLLDSLDSKIFVSKAYL